MGNVGFSYSSFPVFEPITRGGRICCPHLYGSSRLMHCLKWPIHLAVACAVIWPVAGIAQTANLSVLYWECFQQFDDQYHVHCVPRRHEMHEPVSVIPVFPAGEYLSGSSGARNIRPVAQRGDAEIFSVTAWRVPLYSLPLDTLFVAELLRSVLCGRSAACGVSYAFPEVLRTRSSRSSPQS